MYKIQFDLLLVLRKDTGNIGNTDLTVNLTVYRQDGSQTACTDATGCIQRILGIGRRSACGQSEDLGDLVDNITASLYVASRTQANGNRNLNPKGEVD